MRWLLSNAADAAADVVVRPADVNVERLASTSVRSVRAPFVSVTRRSSWMLTRAPGQPKFAGLLRSTLVVDGRQRRPRSRS